MEDTGWPHAPLDDYTAFWGEVYAADAAERSAALLRIEACFQIAHGAGRRPEAILLQKVVSHEGLLRLLETETPRGDEAAGHVHARRAPGPRPVGEPAAAHVGLVARMF